MPDQGILNVFASHAFLRGLADRHLLKLASGVRPFRAAPGDYLASEGKDARSFYLIQEGQMLLGFRTVDRGVVPLQRLGPGDVLGWSWLVPPHRWQFDAWAESPVQGLQFDAEWLRQQCEQDHELGYHLLRQLVTVIADRLAAARRQLQALDANPKPRG